MSIPKQPPRRSGGTRRKSAEPDRPAPRDKGRPKNVPEIDPLLPATLKNEDFSWVPIEVRSDKVAYREMLRVYLAVKSAHGGVNDIDRLQIIEFGRAYLRIQQYNTLAEEAYAEGAHKDYIKATRGAHAALSLVRNLLRDLRLLRITGLKIKSTTPTEDSGWKGLL